ncbi:hypothetical protein J7M23_01150 [Candidatus Sumerlaeota bacterium]|nr:hypothetical protein [Candidatus Sumerlaeota bacterium]
MKVKSLLSLFFCGTVFLFILSSDFSSGGDSIESALQWISNTQTDLGGWTSGEMALKYSYAVRALALAGERNTTFRQIYVRLKQMQSPNGSWDNSINATSEAIWALIEAGDLPNISPVKKGVAWLKSKQKDDGHWGETTTIRKTSLACIVLQLAGESESTELQKGIQWLKSVQNENGWWGLDPGSISSIGNNHYPLYALYLADPDDTSTQKALNWFKSYNPNQPIWYIVTTMGLAYVGETIVMPTRLNQLMNAQNADGGWGDHTGWPSSLSRTCMAIIGLSLAKELGHSEVDPCLTEALNWVYAYYTKPYLTGEYTRVYPTGLIIGAISPLLDPSNTTIEKAVNLYKSVGTGWSWSFHHRPPYEYRTDTTGVSVWGLTQTQRSDVCSIIDESVDKILVAQNSDGGWGVWRENSASTIYYTLHALWGLISVGYTTCDSEVINGFNYLASHSSENYLDDTLYNALYSWLLNQVEYSSDTVWGLYEHLYYAQNPDGGWGATADDKFSAVSPTAMAMIALSDCETQYRRSILRGRRWLKAHQNPDGSWAELPMVRPKVNSSKATAYALWALSRTQDVDTTPRLFISVNKKRYLPGDSARISITCNDVPDSLHAGVVLPDGTLQLLNLIHRSYDEIYDASLKIDENTSPGAFVVSAVAEFPGGEFDAAVLSVEVDSPYQTDYIADQFEENERWVQDAAPGQFEVPEFIEEPGHLGLKANAINTFGYWTSFDQIIYALPESIYRAEFRVSSTATDCTLVPGFRLRLNRDDYQLATDYVVNSYGDGAHSPTTEGKTYEVYCVPFQGPGVTDDAIGGLIASFDIMYFEPSDDPNTVLYLDEINIERIPVSFIADEFSTQVAYTFDTDTEGWTTDTATVFDAPEFIHSGGKLMLRAKNNTNTYGYWWSPPIPVESGKIYRLHARVGSDALSRQEVPGIRVRLNDRSFQSAATLTINSLGNASASPCIGETADYELYFVPAESASSAGMVASFDILNFDSGDKSDGLLTLDLLTVDSAQLPLF